MTRPREEIERAGELYRAGKSVAGLARELGIPRSTVKTWKERGYLEHGLPENAARRLPACCEAACPHIAALPSREYAYLFGLYLGDGTISRYPRGVFRLRIFLDTKYPGILDECQHAMEAVLPNRVGRIARPGCFEVCSYSKHWRCLFPQLGPGPKHLRTIALRPWQLRLALSENPEPLLRGLIHSDGCRVLNVVNGTAYPRYHFSNNSDDIRGIFVAACHRIGVTCRHNNWKEVSVARRASVAQLDEFIGSKR
ncbi:MAG TPA: hypothetical protein VND62_07155 [Acidimicrobiales bacterium]|nr:hypothetical protein [Acidimicrobiales bacterium]